MKEARYLKETYIDQYHTLTQSILIDLVLSGCVNIFRWKPIFYIAFVPIL